MSATARTISLGGLCLVASSWAIVVPKALAQTPVAPPGWPVTAAEHAYGLEMYQEIGLVGDTGQRVPRPQVEDAITQRARMWITSLQATPVAGLQLDPLGVLYVRVGEDAAAQRQFAARLATPGLSIPDRAYTLLLATKAFGRDAENAERLTIALAYLAQLDALPATESVVKQFEGHRYMADAYYMVGNGPAVVAHAMRALGLAPALPYIARGAVFGSSPFVLLADVLSGLPQGRQQIDSIGVALRAYVNIPPELRDSQDSLFWQWLGNRFSTDLTRTLQLTGYLGKPAAAITATHWFNMPAPTTPSTAAPGATTKTLGDGTIRLMEFGDLFCPHCQDALPRMERIRKAVAGAADVWFVTHTFGFWGATLCTPDEEAAHLHHYYTERKGYGLPIALWAGPKDPEVDGSSTPREDPTFGAYALRAFPTFVLTDGAGIVRHITQGSSSEMERLLLGAVQYLVAEAKHPGMAPALSNTRP